MEVDKGGLDAIWVYSNIAIQRPEYAEAAQWLWKWRRRDMWSARNAMSTRCPIGYVHHVAILTTRSQSRSKMTN